MGAPWRGTLWLWVTGTGRWNGFLGMGDTFPCRRRWSAAGNEYVRAERGARLMGSFWWDARGGKPGKASGLSPLERRNPDRNHRALIQMSTRRTDRWRGCMSDVRCDDQIISGRTSYLGTGRENNEGRLNGQPASCSCA
jgi:hypothetical protein